MFGICVLMVTLKVLPTFIRGVKVKSVYHQIILFVKPSICFVLFLKRLRVEIANILTLHMVLLSIPAKWSLPPMHPPLWIVL